MSIILDVAKMVVKIGDRSGAAKTGVAGEFMVTVIFCLCEE